MRSGWTPRSDSSRSSCAASRNTREASWLEACDGSGVMRHVTNESAQRWRDQNWRKVLLGSTPAAAVLTVALLFVVAPRPAIGAQDQVNLAEMAARGREAMQARRYDDAVA